MKIKRLAALLLAGVMTLGLAACGKTEEPATSTSKTETSVSASTETSKEAEPATDEKVTLTMWCIATESDSNRHAYEAAIADMQAKYPNVNFTWEAFENQSYKTKIKAAVSANEMPDIFFGPGQAGTGFG